MGRAHVTCNVFLANRRHRGRGEREGAAESNVEAFAGRARFPKSGRRALTRRTARPLNARWRGLTRGLHAALEGRRTADQIHWRLFMRTHPLLLSLIGLAFVGACSRSADSHQDDALKNDLALAAQAQSYTPSQFTSPSEQQPGGTAAVPQYAAAPRAPQQVYRAPAPVRRAPARRTASRTRSSGGYGGSDGSYGNY